MRTAAALKQALANYVKAHEEMHSILAESEEGWRKRYLALRRRMADHVAALIKLADTLQSAGVDPLLVSEFKARLSRLRHCIALHQSEWPVVAIDPRDTAYRASLQRLSDARTALVMSADQVLATMQ